MKVLVLGAYGMLGHELVRRLNSDYDVYATARSRNGLKFDAIEENRIILGIDASNFQSIEKTVSNIQPDVIINCIGLIKQLSSSSDPLLMMYLNSVFPHKCANVARDQGARLIHFSTDCIFSGKRGMYKTADASDAEDLYGKTKFFGEVSYNNCLTIRSSIIGPELGTKNGLFEWFLSQRGGSIKGYRNAIYSGFTTLEMSRIVSTVIDKHPGLHGVCQVASSPISKFDLLSLINDRIDLGITIEPDYSFKCDRSLDGSEFNKATGYQPPSWPQMVDELAEDIVRSRMVG